VEAADTETLKTEDNKSWLETMYNVSNK